MASNAAVLAGTIPSTLDAINAEWITRALRSVTPQSSAVSSFSIKQLGEGYGQTGITARISLNYAGDAPTGDAAHPRSVIVKMATDDTTRKAIARSMGLYEREVRFYQDLATQVDVRKPVCYFGDLDSANDGYALLLEDFPAHRPGDEITGCSPADARLAVVQMARLHGPYWNKASSLDLPSFPNFSPAKHADAWDRMVADFGEFIPAELRKAKNAFFESLPKLEQWINGAPNTVIHGDMKLDNLLFGEPGSTDEIIVLDWQGIRAGKGMTDFAYLITQNMATEERRNHEAELLELYVKTLRDYDVAYDLEQCKQDYRRAMLFLLVIVVAITGLMINPHERAIRRKKGLVQRTAAALSDWKALDLLPFEH